MQDKGQPDRKGEVMPEAHFTDRWPSYTHVSVAFKRVTLTQHTLKYVYFTHLHTDMRPHDFTVAKLLS